MKQTAPFEALLSHLRPPQAKEVPAHALNRTALSCSVPVLPLPALDRPLRLAVDLDDTIVHNSHTCPELWEHGGYQGRDILPGYAYGKLRSDWRGYARRLLGRARHDTIDRRRHPFLRNPRVIVAPNPAMLALLTGLKAQGAVLVLATASARARVDYLFDRLPILKALFDQRVVCAEDLAERATKAATLPDAGPPAAQDAAWALSAAAHMARPFSLMAKTPWALAPWFDGEVYDFLIDDSRTTAALFNSHGLGAYLIGISGQSFGPRAWDAVATCMARIYGAPGLPVSSEQIRLLRLEDPLYWPFIHVSDQFEAPNG